jgi:hypothetical protein
MPTSTTTDPANPETGFKLAERKLVASSVLAKCDVLDGATDGLMQDVVACQSAFSLDRADVPVTWAAGRTRPLCPYPKVARYAGGGSLEEASSFRCE